MAKANPSRIKVKGVPNKHLHARTTFLYQAATYLTLQSGPRKAVADIDSGDTSQAPDLKLNGPSGLALELGSQMHTVSRKGQVRLSAELKRTICKRCNAILIPGRNATQIISNDSKGGKKPWADVLVLTCTFCGGTKRFAIGAKRQKRKSERCDKATVSANEDMNMSTRSTSPTLRTVTDQSSALLDSNTPSSIT